jgi:MFS family permease
MKGKGFNDQPRCELERRSSPPYGDIFRGAHRLSIELLSHGRCHRRAYRLGRRLLFFITLGLYLISTTATAFSWNLESFCLFRMLTGAGIGGEYSAVNSTIQEMIPARYRGWTDLAINGSFWIGGAWVAAGSIILLDPTRLDPDVGWRLTFLIGSALGLVSFFSEDVDPGKPALARHSRKGDGS